MEQSDMLDCFEKLLQSGLEKILRGEGLIAEEALCSPDLETIWNDNYLKEYTADAVENFNNYPEVAIAWAAFLGMGVAHNWDKDWVAHKRDSYQSYYGSRGWDDMDEHVLWELLELPQDLGKKVSEYFDSCAIAALGLIRHENIEPQTATGFYVLVRAYTVMFRMGVAVELHRLGYKKVAVPTATS